jgi:hypothetical protein
VRHDDAGNQCVIADLDVPRDAGFIDHHDIVAHVAVVRNVRVSHEIAVVANCCFVSLDRRLVHGNLFAKHIVVTDDDFSLRVIEVQILPVFTNRRAGKESVVLAERHPVYQRRLNADNAAWAYFNVGPDISLGPTTTSSARFAGFSTIAVGEFWAWFKDEPWFAASRMTRLQTLVQG